MVTFENLRIQRLIVHEVVLASTLNTDQQPVMSQGLTQLDPAGLSLVGRRLAEALGTESHSIEVSIDDAGDGSAFQHAAGLLDATDAEFVALSQELARKLSRAQTVGSIKSGVAVIAQATVGTDTAPRRLAVIIKAESDAAFVKRNLQQGVTLEFVKEMVFGAQQRLFKIGAFLAQTNAAIQIPAVPSDFEAVVYDHQMNIKGEGSAAQYFYATFLGTTMVASTPQLNKRFFDATGHFIATSNRSREEKSALRSDLISYFRSTTGTISGREFSDRYFSDSQERQRYLAHIYQAGIPRRTISKDSRFFRTNSSSAGLSFPIASISALLRRALIDKFKFSNLQLRGRLYTSPAD